MLAQALDNHATVLAGVDRHDEALVAAEEAVTISRQLADRPRLASALRSYGARLLALRGAAEARAVTAESVRLYRELAAADHRAYRSALAEAVGDLAAMTQSDRGFGATSSRTSRGPAAPPQARRQPGP